MNSLSVALVLTAVNNLNPGINSAVSKVKEFKSAADKIQPNQSIKYNTKWFEDQSKATDDLKKKLKKLKGEETMQLAKGMAKAFDYSVGLAADFEEAMKKVEMANYDASTPLDIQKEQLRELSKLAMELGHDTVFSNTEAANAQLALIKNGMNYVDVLEGGAKASVYLAQTAGESTTVTADAVSQVANMFQLSGSQLMQAADSINRAANASSAGVTDIMRGLQHTGQSAYNLGLNVKETALLLGTLHNMGLGDSSGAFLNDLLLGLDAVSPEAKEALYNLGLLKGATVTTAESGKTEIVGGESSLLDEKGQLKSAQDLVSALRQTLYQNQIDPELLFDKSGNMVSNEVLENILGAKKASQVINDMKKAFGTQGMRAAIALTVSGKGSYEEMVQKAQRMKDIQEQVIEMQGTLAGMFEAVRGSWESLMTDDSTPIGQELKKTVRMVTEYINKAAEWAQANPKVAASILKLIGFLAAFNITAGAVKLLFGNIGGVLSGFGGVALKAGIYFKGFGESYKLLTSVMGQGKISSFFKAFTFGTKLDFILRMFGSIGRGALGMVAKVGKVGGAFLATGANALIAGGKMALAWFIGLGPVGWIIAGITALVIAAIAAWKTNFLGFRDKVLEVWGGIQDVLAKVKDFFVFILDLSIDDVLAKVKEFFGFKPDESINNASDEARRINYSLSQDKISSTIGSNNNRAIVDNRQYIYNVQSTDPRLTAEEISKNNNDKYYRSRDPRFAQ